MKRTLLLILFFPVFAFSQGDLSLSLGLGPNWMKYSLEDNQSSYFSFDSKTNISVSAWLDYGFAEKAFLRGRLSYVSYSLAAYDSINGTYLELENKINYVETAVLVFYRPTEEYGLYLGGGPVAWWVLGKSEPYFETIQEDDLKNLFGVDVLIGYQFRLGKANLGVEAYVSVPLTDAMKYQDGEREVVLKAGRIAGLRLFLNFGLNN